MWILKIYRLRINLKMEKYVSNIQTTSAMSSEIKQKIKYPQQGYAEGGIKTTISDNVT
jgi:hypothetical protein